MRLDDFSIHTRARTVATAVNDLETIRGVALDLLRTLDPQRPVRLLGVGVAEMEQGTAEPRAPASDQLQLLG